jgi:hypothetical protein
MCTRLEMFVYVRSERSQNELLMSMIVPKLAMIFRHRVTLNELAIQVCFYIQD